MVANGIETLYVVYFQQNLSYLKYLCSDLQRVCVYSTNVAQKIVSYTFTLHKEEEKGNMDKFWLVET